jgi:hypothetical protein
VTTKTDRIFISREIVDENTYVDCVFRGATIVYFGGGPPSFVGCSFEGCVWQFKASAQNTVSFLRAMSCPESGFRPLFEQLFTGVSAKPMVLQ